MAMTGWHVTTNDIKNWTETNKRQSEEKLPLLVKKLILASFQPKRLRIPSDDDIALPGWDGNLEVNEGNRFIPSGISCWEFGSNKDVKKKAEKEYLGRLSQTEPSELGITTFIFVTSRIWTRRDEWVNQKILDNKWKDVKGMDAETLADWLEDCPSVHRWFSQVIGKRCPDIWDIEEAWTAFSNQTSTLLTKDFLLHGREEESELLLNLISSNAQHLIKSNSRKEAYGFILASLLNNEEANCRCLIIQSQQAWNDMAASKQSLILIPYGFLPDSVGLAIAKGHTVLLAVDDKDARRPSIELKRQTRLDREEGLKKLWSNDNKDRDEKARILYQDTKGFFDPLLRHNLLKAIDYQTPKWIEETSPDILFAILFASAWYNNNEHDRQAMEVLSGINYPEFEKEIISLSKTSDPPIRKIGELWQVIAKMDFWLLIASQLADFYLERLWQIAPLVLTDENPAYDLPANQRYMASVLRAVPKYSPFLKQGIADSLALLSVFGDQYCELWSQKPSSLINSWIFQVFNSNQNIKFWFSIQDCLTLLAEAAPDVCLSTIERALEGDEPLLLGLFKEEGNGSFEGGCYHSSLLWALELVSWDKKYLARVSQCLACLSKIDPGGKYLNRPFNSLVDIYLGWINNTSATHDERIQILTNCLIPHDPDVSWRLMIALLINHHDSTTGICTPKYRDWHKNIERSTTIPEFHEYVGKIVDLLLQELERDIEHRIIDLIDEFNSYTPKQTQRIIEKMLTVNVEELPDEQRKEILEKVRNTLAHHREFPGAKWAWHEDLLMQLETVYYYFEFKDLVKRNTFLFNAHLPSLIHPLNRMESDYREQEKLFNQMRVSALEKIFTEQGIEGIQELIVQSFQSRLIGSTAFQSTFAKDFFPWAIQWLEFENKCGEFATGYCLDLVSQDYEKSKNILLDNEAWSPLKKAKFLLCMQYVLNQETLRLAENIPQDGQNTFWSKITNFIVQDESAKTASDVISKLLKHDRPLAAINAIGITLFGIKKNLSDLDRQVVVNVLMRIATNPTDSNGRFDGEIIYNITQAIKFIQNSETISEEDICLLEWFYLKLLKHEDFTPQYLINNIRKDSSFFSQLISWIYKRDDLQEDTEQGRTDDFIDQRAGIAYDLLEQLSILPGQQGNNIDKNILADWIQEARQSLKEMGRLKIGDNQIGYYLSKSPKGEDRIWPHESVRNIIECIKSQEFEQAILCGHLNRRGVSIRSPYAGGKQELLLAQKYKSNAESLELIWPRSAYLLRQISAHYQGESIIHDHEAEIID